MQTRASLVIALAILSSCKGGNPDEISAPDDAVTLDWSQGDEFHVATEYRATHNKTEETSVDFDSAGIIGDTHAENWSDEVVWSFQAVESNFVPDATDDLYEYAVVGNGREVASLTVLRAYVDTSLNDDPELLEANPVVYMVFNADRDRLAAIISFSNVDGERLEQAFSISNLDKSYSELSQSMLTAAPTYLAPFSAGYRDETKVLENGSVMESFVRDDGVVDVAYEDEVGGGIIVSTYEDGQPWPTYTDGNDIKGRLLSADEVDSRRTPGLLPDPPEDYDFRAALASKISLDDSLVLDEATMAGGWEGGAPVGYRPWAGSWWRQSEGALIFSANNKPSISDEIQPTVDPIKTDMDNLSSSMRDMDDKDSTEYTEARDEYRTKQGELVDAISTFYNGVLSDLNGGAASIEDNSGTIQVVHTGHGSDPGHEGDWSYDVDDLSPLDKYALQMWADGNTSSNPFFAPAWEILNHYSPAGGSWWGHCNGWAAAAILTDEPREEITTQIKGHDMVWTHGDVKGLLTETHYSTYSRFYGERYNGEEQDINDLSPKHFHQLIQFYLRDQQVPMVFDTTKDEAVWNYPAFWADVEVEETTPAGEGAASTMVNINTADMAELQDKLGVDEDTAWWIYEWRLYFGAYQAVEDLKDNWGIKPDVYESLVGKVVVKPSESEAPTERTFHVVATVRFTTDGVGEEHLDDDNENPESLPNKVWGYTLTTDSKGKVLEGTWDDDHPDFAWIPYSNPMGAPRGGSENGYMSYENVIKAVGNFDRE